MSTKQQKILSGYGHHTTADDVLAEKDLTGKFAIVTGGYSGIGLETTRALSKAGATVLVPARRPDVARERTAGMDNVEIATLDLAELRSVRAFAEDFLSSGRAVDYLINDAGIMGLPETRVGPGWESQFAVNHLGHYTLVNILWPILASSGARVVVVSSAGHHFSDIRWDDLHFHQGYDKFKGYSQSKTANALFALQLDELGKSDGVRAFSLHPGEIPTELPRHLTVPEMMALGWTDEHGTPIKPTFKSPEQGAATQVWAATSAQLDGLGGVYCEDCDIAEPATNSGELVGVRGYATDPEAAARLWAVTRELTGVDAFQA